MICQECHHKPSGRTAEHGAECQCKCHDVADAAPALLAALHGFVDPWRIGGPKWESKINYDTYNNARNAIAKAEGK